MIENMVAEGFSPKKEDFEFILTINDNIICQRYFRINGFKKESYSSMDLVRAIDDCVNLIDNDLKVKTQIYYEATSPQVFQDKEEMEQWGERHRGESVDMPIYVVLEDDDSTYIWDGNDFSLYERNFNKSDYVETDEENNQYILKFSFRDNGVEKCSKIWDASVYPRFVRTNIDLSNSKNKYRTDGVFAPVEKSVIDMFIESQKDLIPLIVKELCDVCSYEDVSEYETYDTYTNDNSDENITYDLSINRANSKYFRKLERAYRSKTQNYFKK